MKNYRIKYPLPDLVNEQWAMAQLNYLIDLAIQWESDPLAQQGYAVSLRSWSDGSAPDYKTDGTGIAYLPLTKTISEFQLYFKDGKVRPYMRWIANQDALEAVSHYIYGTMYPQYRGAERGWERNYVEAFEDNPNNNFHRIA